MCFILMKNINNEVGVTQNVHSFHKPIYSSANSMIQSLSIPRLKELLFPSIILRPNGRTQHEQSSEAVKYVI
jgi:hypothetical protein